MPEIYGIDLGTRNTAVECGRFRLSMDGATIPSAVAYDLYTEEVKFGQEAMAILRSSDALERERWTVATSFKTALESDAPFVSAGRGTKTAQDVLEDYFRALNRYAYEREGQSIGQAVFSIPVGFGVRSRASLLKAALKAGIEPLGIVSESTAAYINYHQLIGGAQRVAVVDWGAGTLDVSVLHVVGAGAAVTTVDEQACNGSRVAGDHIDLAIYEAFAAKVRQEGRQIDPIDRVPVARLRSVLNACERAKIALSDRAENRASTDIVVPAFVDGKSASFTLTAEALRDLAAPAIDEVFDVLERSIGAAGLSIQQVDRIIFVGGCTGVLGFEEQANARYEYAAYFPNNPEWVVASGALRVAGGGASYELLQEFGCVLDDGFFLPLHGVGPRPGGESHVVVAATESTPIASLVIAERQAGRVGLLGTLAVPLQGHPGEPVNIQTTFRNDLTVAVEAHSQCCDESMDRRRLDILNTRFRFRIG